MAMNEGSEITFDIIEEIGIISTQETGWTKELNLIRWNGGLEKYDIREWDPYHERMSRGITLKEEEMRRILDLMKRRRDKAWSRRKNSAKVPADVARDMAADMARDVDAGMPRDVDAGMSADIDADLTEDNMPADINEATPDNDDFDEEE